jgi:STE24 endopeptidase
MLDFLISIETIFYVIIVLFVLEFLLTKTLSFLNTTKWSPKLPVELKDIYDEEKYSKSMEYEKVKYNF